MSTQIIFIQVQQKIFIHPFASFWISVNSITIPCHSYFFYNKCYNLHCCRTLWLVWLHKCCNILYYCTSNSRCFQIEQNWIAVKLWENHFFTFYCSLLNIHHYFNFHISIQYCFKGGLWVHIQLPCKSWHIMSEIISRQCLDM